MTQRNPILLAAAATVVGGAALVLLIRAMIPSGGDVDPSLVAREPVIEDVVAPSVLVADSAASAPVVTAVANEDVVQTPPVVAPEPAQPVVEPVAQPVVAQPLMPDVAVVVAAPETPGPIEPIASIRADIDRLRAQVDAINARNADGGASGTTTDPSMALLVRGAPIVRRLTAGDPTFADQVRRYRSALANAGALDANGRASLRASIFTAQYAERAAAYDDVLALTR